MSEKLFKKFCNVSINGISLLLFIGPNVVKKNSKQPTESAIKDSITTNSEATSSNMHNDILPPKTKDQRKRKASKKRDPEMVEKTSSQEQHSVDDKKKTSRKRNRKTSEPNVKEIGVNESKKMKKKDVTNMIDINLQTSTPKQKLPTIVGETAKNEKLIAKKNKLKVTGSENKLEKYIKLEEKKQRKRTSKKNAKDVEYCQTEGK